MAAPSRTITATKISSAASRTSPPIQRIDDSLFPGSSRTVPTPATTHKTRIVMGDKTAAAKGEKVRVGVSMDSARPEYEGGSLRTLPVACKPLRDEFHKHGGFNK